MSGWNYKLQIADDDRICPISNWIFNGQFRGTFKPYSLNEGRYSETVDRRLWEEYQQAIKRCRGRRLKGV